MQFQSFQFDWAQRSYYCFRLLKQNVINTFQFWLQLIVVEMDEINLYLKKLKINYINNHT